MTPFTKPRVITAAVVLMLGLAACNTSSSATGGSTSSSNEGTPVRGGTLNMLGKGDVDHMDPNISYYTIGAQSLRLWSRQLYTFPATPGKVTTAVPDLATGPVQVSADGLTVTVSIRKGAQWDTSPARQVTAADVVRGFKRTCNPVQPFGGLPDYQDLISGFSTFCAGFAKVKPTAAAIAAYQNSTDLPGVKVGADPLTVVFTLNHPASYFQGMLTMTALAPAPAEYDAYAPDSPELAQHLIADGPYKVTSYSATKNITFARNPAWVASSDPVRKAYVDKIVINETVSQESAQQQLQTGTPSADMEFDDFPIAAQLPALIAAKDPLLNLGETDSNNPYLVFNTVSPNNGGAMAKVEFRQALEYAINRTQLIQDRGGPTVNPPLAQVLPKGIVGGTQSPDMYPYDVAKSKQLLQQAGVPAGTAVKILYDPSNAGVKKNFATLQQNLQQVGLKAVGVATPQADIYGKIYPVPATAKRGVWDIGFAGWGPDWYGDGALSYFNPLLSGKKSFPPGGSNFGYYDDPATNALIDQAQKAKTQAEAAALWHQADQQVMKDAALFPINSPLQPNYRAKQVNGAVYVPSLQNFDPANVWLEPKVNGG
jgi:peptide/nickel transport system substrate-binding protein